MYNRVAVHIVDCNGHNVVFEGILVFMCTGQKHDADGAINSSIVLFMLKLLLRGIIWPLVLVQVLVLALV